MDNKPLTPEEFKKMCEATARIRHEISDARDAALIKDFEDLGCTDVYLKGFHFMCIPYIRMYFEVPNVGYYHYDVSAASLRRYCKIAHVVLRELNLL